MNRMGTPFTADAGAMSLKAAVHRSLEKCLEHLLWEFAGVEHVFLFPAHARDTGHELPVREVQASAELCGPLLNAHSGT